MILGRCIDTLAKGRSRQRLFKCWCAVPLHDDGLAPHEAVQSPCCSSSRSLDEVWARSEVRQTGLRFQDIQNYL